MKRIILLVLTIASLQANAQEAIEPAYLAMMQDNSVNFYTVVAAAEAYFKTIDKDKKGSGWKPYQRWRVANEYKYYPDGDRSQVDPLFAEKEFIKFKQQYGGGQNKLFPGGWKEVGPTRIDSLTGHYSAGLGRIEDVYIAPINPNILYLGSRSGGFWKSTNGGNTWTGTTDFLLASGVNTITASPTNPDSVLINVQNARNEYSHGIYRSTNGGNTWTLSNFNPTTVGQGGLGSSFRIYEIAYHPLVPNLIFICTNDGIYRSADNLQTWVKLYAGQSITDMAFHPTNSSVIYIYNSSSAYNNYLLVSNNTGVSYTTSNILAGNGGATSLEISTSPACPNCVYAATTNGVWKSLNMGTNFTFMSNPAQTCRGFAVNDLDTSKMIYGYVDLERSTNGGQTFSQVTAWSLGNTNGAGNGNQISYNTSTDYIHADVRNAKCENGVFYVTTDGFLSKSTDSGVTWQKLNNNMGIRENYSLGVSQSNHYKLVVGSQDNGTSFSVQNGWVELYGADGMEAIVHPLNETWFMGSVQYGSRRLSKNNGASSNGASPIGSAQAYWIAPLAFDPNNHMSIYDFRDTVYRSNDFGETHVKLGRPSSFTGDIQVAEIAQNNSNIMVITQGNKIDKSINGGISFSSIRNNLPSYSIEDVAFDPNNDDVIIVAFGRYQIDNSKVWMTTNGGTSWTNITHNLGSMPIRSVVVDHKGNIYAGAEIGIYTMPMGGSTWTLFNTDLPNVAVLELEVNWGSNTLKAATWGRGVWEYNLVGRKDYPAIVHTKISQLPTLSTPKQGVDQIVTSRISYDNALSSVYTSWSTGTPTFGNIIPMTNSVDSTWVTTTPLPDVTVGTKVFFKVFAVGSNNDTTETYKFMYEQMPFVYCIAMGDSGSGNLFLNNVTLENINNNSGNNLYTDYTNQVVTLYADSTYQIDVTANTGWASNDYAAWIDYNHDAEFSVDERILYAIGPGANATNNFTVPTNAQAGDTVKMRVRLSYWNEAPRPCGTQFGEVEDYVVILKSKGWPVGVQPISKQENEIIIYPNPTSGKVNVDFTKRAHYAYTLKNQIGQVLQQGLLNNTNNSFDISSYPMGVYMLQIGQENFKVIKND